MSAIDHALNCHAVKLGLLMMGVLISTAGLVTDTFGVLLLGALLGSGALAQLIVYWRHDHYSCEHPACGGEANGSE